MASLRRAVLGIEIGLNEVRMVELRGGPVPQVLKVGSVPLPAGAVDNERVIQTEVVADIIRGLHSRSGYRARTAVVGMGVQGVVTRILAIPRVPDSELRFVLEGELAHYQILRTGTGVFDYFRLDTAAGEDNLPSVLLMAAEERVAITYRLAVERAGLQVLALEPSTIGLFRVAYPMLEAQPAALCLAITPQRSELSILDHGQIRLYRRLETGSNDFIRGRRSAPVYTAGPVNLAADPPVEDPAGYVRVRTPLNPDDDTAELEEKDIPGSSGSGSGPLPPLGGAVQGEIIPQIALSLANEVQRSLDYYQREFPNAPAVSRIVVATNDPEAGPITEWLAQTLRMEARLVEMPVDPGLSGEVATQLSPPHGLKYLGAVGLAMQAVTADWRHVPRFNLSPGVQATVAPVERDRLTVVLIASLCVLAGGLFSGYLFNRQAQTTNAQVEALRTTLGVTRQNYRELEKRILDEQTLGWIVKSDNLPVPSILDLVTQRMPEGVGLTAMHIQRNGHIVIEGNARSEQDFNIYYANIITCPHFVYPRFQNISTDPKTRITRFRIETSLAGTQDALTHRGGTL
ncbi:MAG: pilus assembly protein PilM [Chloroherpetonaceae bacterium]|nr:pilus assembly protein PilM [Chthonomonadaceae bacterium]MDW8206406.1 pilus assembly protein PilM [Chloroherpetonaceae bacterium]